MDRSNTKKNITKEESKMKIWIISFVAYGDRTEKTQIFDKFFCSRKAAEDMAKWLRACGHSAVKIVPLVQE